MRKEIILILLLILSMSFVLAVPDCPLSIPKTYYGTVFYKGNLLSGTYQITAKIGNDFAGSTNLTNGNYEIDISPCYGITGEVNFYIGDIKTNENGIYTSDDYGKRENLTLTINQLPTGSIVCGDGIKTSNEVCDKNDFGTLTCSNYGFNSGSLRCSSSCDYIYTDNCYNSRSGSSSSGGGGGGGGGSSESGVVPITPTSTGMSTQTSSEGNKTINLTSEKNQKPTSSGITGGVIGNFVKSGGGIATILVLTTIVVLSIAITSMKKKRLAKEQKAESSEVKTE
jgi:hypothetical protein